MKLPTRPRDLLVEWSCFLLVTAFGGLFGGLLGSWHGGEFMKKEAAAAGLAEYVADKNGEPVFRWKTELRAAQETGGE